MSSSLSPDETAGSPRRYTDRELLEAMREVRDSTEFLGLSLRVYRDERSDEHPHRDTIVARFGSWREAHDRLDELEEGTG